MIKKDKKLAVFVSDNTMILGSIVKYFQNSNVEVICLYENKNISSCKDANEMGVRTFELSEINICELDLVAMVDYAGEIDSKITSLAKNIINVHPSILPSYKESEAIKKAYADGVKLSGITIHWVEEKEKFGKIIAQYPVFIENLMSFEEFENAIFNIECKLYPLVIEKILEDKVFDFQDFVSGSKKSTNSSCGGCGNDASGGCSGCGH